MFYIKWYIYWINLLKRMQTYCAYVDLKKLGPLKIVYSNTVDL